MNDKSRYDEVNSGNFGIRWEIAATEKNGMKFTKDSPDNLKEGYYVAVNEISGKDGKPFKIHSIQTVDKQGNLSDMYAITGGAVLDDKMKDVPLNSFVGIEYLGRAHKKGYPATSPWSQTNSYHSWFVGIDRKAVPYAEAQQKATGATVAAKPSAEKKEAAPVQNGAGKMPQNNNFVNQGDDDLPF